MVKAFDILVEGAFAACDSSMTLFSQVFLIFVFDADSGNRHQDSLGCSS